MNTITLTPDTLTIEPRGLDKVWSFTDRITVPLSHVRGATFDPGVADAQKGVRGPGLRIGGKAAGTFHLGGERTFWNVSDPTDNLVIQLVDESFDRVVVTVEDPSGVERAVNAAVGIG